MGGEGLEVGVIGSDGTDGPADALAGAGEGLELAVLDLMPELAGVGRAVLGLSSSPRACRAVGMSRQGSWSVTRL